MENFKEGVAFVIKTNEYAGNFEREMCAHITGVVGDCEVGNDFITDGMYDFDRIIQQVGDENGTYRPCGVGDNSNDVAIFFESEPSPEMIEFMKKRAQTFNEARINSGQWYNNSDIKILGFELVWKNIKSLTKTI